MKKLFLPALLLGGFGLSGPLFAHNGGATAYAFPLDSIKIDGKLSDWPDPMVRYPILTNGRVYGATDIDYADLRTSPDLNASFMVGYDREKNLIFVAVRVQDDSLVHGGGNPWQNDACEVYVDGDNSGGRAEAMNVPASQLPALQYVGIPGKGNYGISKKNPAMYGGDISLTKTQYAFSREGDVTIYEWAIEPYDKYPDSPTKLVPGKRLGFDVVIADKDAGASTSAWICWAGLGAIKFCNADLLGDLVLVEKPSALGTLSGTVKWDGKTPPAALDLDVWQRELPAGTVRTGAKGGYELILPAGTYALRPRRGQGVQDATFEATVSAGGRASQDLAVTSIQLPPALEQSLEVYGKLQRFRSAIEITIEITKPDFKASITTPFEFVYERPGRFAIRGQEGPLEGVLIMSDGKLLSASSERWRQYTQKEAPVPLSLGALQDAVGSLYGSAYSMLPLSRGNGRVSAHFPVSDLLGSVLVPRLMLSPDLRQEVLGEATGVESKGEEALDGQAMSLVVIEKPAILALSGMHTGGIGPDRVVRMKLWIDKKQSLVRQAATEFDMEAIVKSAPKSYLDRTRGMRLRLVERCKSAELDPRLPGDTFSFKPSSTAKLVTRLGRSDRITKEVSDFVGEPAPGFALKDLNGREISLADLKGKVVLLNFWATWCGPCLSEIPTFKALQNLYGKGDFAMLAISTDRTDDVVKAFVKRNKINFTVMMADAKVKEDYGGVPGVPTTFIIDRKGVIRLAQQGAPMSDMQVFQRGVEKLLKE